MKKSLLVLIVLFSFNISANAASQCSYKEQTELLQKASNIKTSYESKLESVQFDPNDPSDAGEIYVFEVSVLNITPEFFVEVKNSVNDEVITLRNIDTENGIGKFKWTDTSQVTNFTASIYTTVNTGCAGEMIKTIHFSTPRYNKYYDREICRELSDFYLCQQFVTTPDVSESQFVTKLKSYQTGEVDKNGEDKTEDKKPTITDKVFSTIDDYKWVILGVAGVAIVVAVVISVKKSKKQRDLGL